MGSRNLWGGSDADACLREATMVCCQRPTLFYSCACPRVQVVNNYVLGTWAIVMIV